MSVTTHTYQELAQLGVPKLTSALEAKENDSMTRAFLYILKCQTSALSTANSLADAVGGSEGRLAASMLDMINESRQEANFEETAILFLMLTRAFENETKLRVYVDYGMDEGKVSEVLDAWTVVVENHRMLGGTNTELPAGRGLPCKRGLAAENGCAYIWGPDTCVIDDQGCVLSENPHAVAYRSEKPEDEQRAWHLQPKRPDHIQANVIHRSMARGAGLKIDDAVFACQQRDFGMVHYLLESFNPEDLSHQKIGRKILKKLCHWHKIDDEDLVIKLIKMGVVLKCLKKIRSSYDSPLFNIIKNTQNLYNVLRNFDIQKQPINVYNMHGIMMNLAGAIVGRFENIKYHFEDFKKLVEFYVRLNPKTVIAKAMRVEICKEIIRIAEHNKCEFRTPTCRESIITFIKTLERSNEADAFMDEVSNVEKFLRGYTGDLRIRSQPVLKKLHATYAAMSETERTDYKTPYEKAIRTMNEALKNSRY